MRMQFKLHYGSHLPVLVRAVELTSGPVLEIGSGLFSTPVLHWLCSDQKRPLVTYEINPQVYASMTQFENEYHRVIFVNSWDDMELEREWDVALIDHDPAERRKVDAAKLANYVRYLLLHDAHPRNERDYHYTEIYPLFRYRYYYGDFPPYCTSVLSNFVDLKDFHV